MGKTKTKTGEAGKTAAAGRAEAKLVMLVMPDGTKQLGSLPLLKDIKLANTETKSATIRWLVALGYSVQDISNHLGIRYQMVRNIATSLPKRAAREETPILEVQLLRDFRALEDGIDEFVEAGIDHELEQAMLLARKERFKNMARTKKADSDFRVLDDDGDEDGNTV